MTIHSYGKDVLDFGAGDRVGMHPATDAFIRGERFGTVTEGASKGYVRVHLDSGRTTQVQPDLLRRV